MGFLSKKPKKNKIYPLKKAMEFVSKNEGYSVVQEGDGFKLIPDKVAKVHIDKYRDRLKERQKFSSSLQTGYTPNPIGYNENLNHEHRYSYHEEER